MTPDSFLCVRVHEAHPGVHEFSGMAHGHVAVEIVVPAPFIREHEAVGSRSCFHKRTQCSLAAVGNAPEEALPGEAGNAPEHPLAAERGFIPLRCTGNASGLEADGQRTQDTVESLSRLRVGIKDMGKVRAGKAGAGTEELGSQFPLTVMQVAAALHGVRTVRECSPAMRATVSLSPAGIFPEAESPFRSTEAAENHACRHK